jgi:glutamate racemase
LTSKNKVCPTSVNKNQAQRKIKDTVFVDEVETQSREKPLRGSQTQEFYYSEDKDRYKIVTLTCTHKEFFYLFRSAESSEKALTSGIPVYSIFTHK